MRIRLRGAVNLKGWGWTASAWNRWPQAVCKEVVLLLLLLLLLLLIYFKLTKLQKILQK